MVSQSVGSRDSSAGCPLCRPVCFVGDRVNLARGLSDRHLLSDMELISIQSEGFCFGAGNRFVARSI